MKISGLKDGLEKTGYRVLTYSYTLAVRWRDKSIFDTVNEYKDSSLVLNLGSGPGLFDRYIEVDMLNLDIDESNSPDVVGDAHDMPFAEESFDCIFCNAVLEHVPRPWVVASEIGRVLKRGSHVCVNVPFLQVGHTQHDYYRFTVEGLRTLFSDFKEIKSGVSAGPFSFLTVFISSYISSFFSGRARSLVGLIINFIVFPLKYLDVVIRNRNMGEFADAVYFIGIKE